MVTTAAETKRERRPHRKSRLGCLSCKQRKIKCDESRPACLNCMRRDVDCEFPKKKSRIGGDGNSLAPGSLSADIGESDTQSKVLGTELASSRSDGTFCTTLRFIPYGKASRSESEAPPTIHHESGVHPIPSSRSQAADERRFQDLSDRISYLENSLITQQPRQQESISELTYADIALMHHYLNLPDKTPENDVLLETSFSHPHLLHLILGFSALHLVRQDSISKNELVVQADKHYMIGMRGATQLLNGTKEESHGGMALAYQSAIMIGLYNLALGPQPGEYLGFSDHDGSASFLVFLRGVRIIHENKGEDTASPASSAAETTNLVAENNDTETYLQRESTCATDYEVQIEHLRCLARCCPSNSLSSTARDTSIYITAINQLEPFLDEIYGPSESQSTDLYSRVPFGWLYRVSGGFINRLQDKAPLALAIFAYFALILKKLETGWVVEGWPEHIMFGVEKFLGPQSRDLIKWPMKEMGLEARLTGAYLE